MFTPWIPDVAALFPSPLRGPALRKLSRCLAISILGLASIAAFGQTFTSFDAPGLNTTPTGINSSGAITGWYRTRPVRTVSCVMLRVG